MVRCNDTRKAADDKLHDAEVIERAKRAEIEDDGGQPLKGHAEP